MKIKNMEIIFTKLTLAEAMCREMWEKTSWVSGKLQKDKYGSKTYDYWYGRNYGIKETINEIMMILKK